MLLWWDFEGKTPAVSPAGGVPPGGTKELFDPFPQGSLI